MIRHLHSNNHTVDIKIYAQLITMMKKKKYNTYFNSDDDDDDDIIMLIKDVKRLSNGSDAKILTDLLLNSNRL